MNSQSEMIIRKEEPIGAEEATALIQDFLSENTELDGIYKIQLDEILNHLKLSADCEDAAIDTSNVL